MMNFGSGRFSIVKKQTTFHTSQLEGAVLSKSSLHKPHTCKTRSIHSKIFVRTGVTILGTCSKFGKFYRVSVTRMQEKKKVLLLLECLS